MPMARRRTSNPIPPPSITFTGLQRLPCFEQDSYAKLCQALDLLVQGVRTKDAANLAHALRILSRLRLDLFPHADWTVQTANDVTGALVENLLMKIRLGEKRSEIALKEFLDGYVNN